MITADVPEKQKALQTKNWLAALFAFNVPGRIRTAGLSLRSGYGSCSFSMLSMSLNACICADVFNV